MLNSALQTLCLPTCRCIGLILSPSFHGPPLLTLDLRVLLPLLPAPCGLQTRPVSATSLPRCPGCQSVASGAAAEVQMELAAQLAVMQGMTSTAH
jgi:hypothetical protein